MSSESVKNDIKTLFLVLNSLNALTTGLFPLSAGIDLALQDEEPMSALYGMATGLPLLGLAALGCFGAIQDNKNYLVTYSAINGLLSTVAAAAVAAEIYTSPPPKMNFFFIDIAVFIICSVLAATALAVFLSKRVRVDSSSAAQRSWLWSGLGLSVTYIVGIVLYMKFVI